LHSFVVSPRLPAPLVQVFLDFPLDFLDFFLFPSRLFFMRFGCRFFFASFSMPPPPLRGPPPNRRWPLALRLELGLVNSATTIFIPQVGRDSYPLFFFLLRYPPCLLKVVAFFLTGTTASCFPPFLSVLFLLLLFVLLFADWRGLLFSTQLRYLETSIGRPFFPVFFFSFSNGCLAWVFVASFFPFP